jgi:hypothetical protein
MTPVGTQSIWKSSTRLADGREIVYFDEPPGLGRAAAADTRPLPPRQPGPGLPYGRPEWGIRRDALPEARGQFAAHLQVLSVRRAADKLKYLAGTESGMGVWINDIVPEKAAQRLREA